MQVAEPDLTAGAGNAMAVEASAHAAGGIEFPAG